MPKSTGEARDRTRTDDPVLTKDVLYRLSYPGAERQKEPCNHPDPHTTETGAGNGIRTRDIQLGRLTLYQLSYSRSRCCRCGRKSRMDRSIYEKDGGR